MSLENSSPPQPSAVTAAVIPAETPGITEAEAATRISAILNPKPPRKPSGQFESRQPAAPAEAVEAEPEEISEPDDEAPSLGDDEAATGEDAEIEVGDETEQANAPAFDVPSSWGKAAEAIWQDLKPEAQQFILQLDAKRSAGIERQLQELKAKEESVSQIAQAIEQERLQLAQAAQRYQSDALKQFQAKFGDVKDTQQLARENPARYIEMQAAWSNVQAAQYEADQLQQAQRQQTIEQMQNFRAEENRKLVEQAGLKDEVTAKAFEKSVMEFTTKVGIPAERVAQYRADELLMVRDAMRYREAVAKKAAAMKAQNPPPRVLKPGAPSSQRSLSAQTQQEQLSKQLRKTGNENDAAKLIKARVFGSRR